MSRSRMGRAALAAAVTLAAAAGCGKKNDDGEAAVEAAREAELLAALDGLDAMPASATAVLGVDVAALAASPLAQRATGQLLLRDSELAARLAELGEGCELTPAEDVDRVLIGLVPAEGEAPAESVLVARGRFEETALVTCLGRMLGGGLTSRTVGGRTLYRASEKDAEGVWLGFGSGRTAVVASSEAALAAALGDGPKLSSRDEMVRLIGRAGVDGAAVWAAGIVAPEVGEGLVASTGGEVGAPRTLFGHLGLAGGLDLFLGAELPSAEDANKLVSLANMQLEAAALVAQRHGLGRLVRRLEATAEGATVRLSLSLTDPELAQLLSAIDIDPASAENPAPESGPEGDVQDGQRDAPPGDEAPAR